MNCIINHFDFMPRKYKIPLNISIMIISTSPKRVSDTWF